MIDLSRLSDIQPQMWVIIGVVLIVFALIPSILFVLLGAFAILFRFFFHIKQKNTRGKVF